MLIYNLIHRHVWWNTDSHLKITAIDLVTGWTELQTHALALDLRVKMCLSLSFNCIRNLWLSSLIEHCTVCWRKVLFLLSWLDYCMQEEKRSAYWWQNGLKAKQEHGGIWEEGGQVWWKKNREHTWGSHFASCWFWRILVSISSLPKL